VASLGLGGFDRGHRAAHGPHDERLEQTPAIGEMCVDGGARDTGLSCDGRDARLLAASEQALGGVEDRLAVALGDRVARVLGSRLGRHGLTEA
jgi:hypothetical protein